MMLREKIAPHPTDRPDGSTANACTAPAGTTCVDVDVTRARFFCGIDHLKRLAEETRSRRAGGELRPVATKTVLEWALDAYLSRPLIDHDCRRLQAVSDPGPRGRVHLHLYPDQAESLADTLALGERRGHDAETVLLIGIEAAADALQAFARRDPEPDEPAATAGHPRSTRTETNPAYQCPASPTGSITDSQFSQHLVDDQRAGEASGLATAQGVGRPPTGPRGRRSRPTPEAGPRAERHALAGDVLDVRLLHLLHITSAPRHPDGQPAAVSDRAGSLDPGLGASCGVPSGPGSLGSVTALLEAAGLAMDEVERFTADPTRWYQPRSRKKGKGKPGRRHYHEPDPDLLEVQRKLLPVIRAVTPPLPLRRRTQKETAAPHAGARWFVHLDVRNCYPSMTAAMVASALEGLGAVPEVIDLILRLTTLNGRLVQGAATSGALADLVLLPLDQRLQAEAGRLGATATKWGDDVGVSAYDRDAVEAIAEAYVQDLAELGLRARRKGPMDRGGCRKFLKFNLSTRRPTVPKTYRRPVERAVRRVARYGCRPGRGKRGQPGYRPDERKQLAGKIAYAAPLHPKWASRLREMLARAPHAGVEATANACTAADAGSTLMEGRP